MSFKVSLAFCIIFVLRSSVYGEIYTVYDHIEAEIEKCGSGGQDSSTQTFNIDTIDNLQYDALNENTVVIAYGKTELKTGLTYPFTLQAFPLNKYKEDAQVKTYMGRLTFFSEGGWTTQQTSITFTLTIPREGTRQFEVSAWAGSWGSIFCSKAKSVIESVKIVV